MKKTYRENKTNQLFTFDSQKLRNSFYSYLLKGVNHEESWITREKLVDRLTDTIDITPESVYEHISGDNYPDDIEDIYGYGEFFCDGDKYAFLCPCEGDCNSYDDTGVAVACDDITKKTVSTVYSMLIQLISEFFEHGTASDVSDSGKDFVYFRRVADKIETTAEQIYNHDDLTTDLLSIIRDVKKTVCACEIPGVPVYWYDINKNLRFYTTGFHLLTESPEFYMTLKNSRTPLTLDYYPEDYELELCYEYFAELYRNSTKNNFQYEYYDFLKQEIITTVKLLFETKISPHLMCKTKE